MDVPARGNLGEPRFRPCPVCNGDHVEILHTQHLGLPEEFALPEDFDLVCCAHCGMVYSDTAPEPERLTAYYRASTYVFGNWADRERPAAIEAVLGSPFDVSRLDATVDLLATAIGSHDARILDVGCASGHLLALLAERGFSDVQGIDPSPSAVATAKARGGRATVGDLDSLPADLGTFDVVVVTHVLEHLGRPREALARLRDLVRPGGLVYAEVPDASRYADFLVEPFVDVNVEHVNHFSPQHLDELMRRSGFVGASNGRNDFELADGWPYPAIYGAWRRVESPTASDVLDRSAPYDRSVLRERMVTYVQRSRELLSEIDAVLTERLAGRRRIAVRCLGYRAWNLLGATMLRDLDVVAYVDSDPAKQQLTIRGVRVTGPEARLEDDVAVVVLAYHAEAAVVAEYAAADPGRDVIVLGRSGMRAPALAR